jgi:hypothetical protein
MGYYSLTMSFIKTHLKEYRISFFKGIGGKVDNVGKLLMVNQLGGKF